MIFYKICDIIRSVVLIIYTIFAMSEKVFVEVGVFNIDPSISDEYNVPIGLAIGHQDCDGGGGEAPNNIISQVWAS